MTRGKGIDIIELFQKTYDLLVKRHSPSQVVFPSEVYVEIADDSDWHRNRKGYMKYSSVGLFQLNGKNWAVTRGVNGGGYPADAYRGDILVLEFDLKRASKDGRKIKKTPKTIEEELKGEIENSDYFRNSLIIGMYDGRLASTRSNNRGMRLMELLGDSSRFVAHEREIRDDVIHLDLRHVVSSPTLYKLEFVGFLTDSIEKVLID